MRFYFKGFWLLCFGIGLEGYAAAGMGGASVQASVVQTQEIISDMAEETANTAQKMAKEEENKENDIAANRETSGASVQEKAAQVVEEAIAKENSAAN